MRYVSVLLLSLVLASCDLVPTTTHGPVDAANLPPLTSREQALIFGADGAAQQGNAAAAERDYLSAASLSTGHIEAHLALARLYEKQNQPSNERDILTRALALQPNHPLVNYMLGKLDLDAFHYADALTSFDRGLKQRPDDIDLNTGKAIANDMLGNHTAAQMVYTRAMRVNPQANLATLRTNLAMSYLLGGDAKRAAEILQADVKKPGASSVTRHNLALAYGVMGRHAEARKILAGEIDEDTRMLAIARLKEYWHTRDSDGRTPPLKPTVHSAAAAENAAAKPTVKKAKPVSAATDHSAMATAIKKAEAANTSKPTAGEKKAPTATDAATGH